MTAIKNLLKRCIPWTVRRHRYLIRHACNHLRYQFGPAPLNDFSDYDHYWAQRGEKVDAEGPLRRWVIAAECIAEHSSLLDFGCGTGEFLTYIRSVKPTVKAKEADLLLHLLERAADDVYIEADHRLEVHDTQDEVVELLDL